MLIQRAGKSQRIVCQFESRAADKSIWKTIQRNETRADYKNFKPVFPCGGRYSPVRCNNGVFIHNADRTAGIALFTGDHPVFLFNCEIVHDFCVAHSGRGNDIFTGNTAIQLCVQGVFRLLDDICERYLESPFLHGFCKFAPLQVRSQKQLLPSSVQYRQISMAG